MGSFGIIYKVTNKVNNKIYIGQTVQSLNSRRWSHESKARLGKTRMVLPKAISKYGEDNFAWDIIEYCDSKKELNEMEFHYIKQYSSIAPNGYNLTLGGEGCEGFKHSEESKKTMNNFKIGTKLSKKSIDKRSLLQSYDWEIITPDGETKIIRNLSKFCNDNNLNAQGMYRTSRGDRKYYKKYKCRKLTINSNKISSESTKIKISAANKGRKLTPEQLKQRVKSEWEIIYPDNSKKIIVNLKKFCGKNDMCYGYMLKVANGIRTHHKGFKCRKIGG